MNAPIHSIWNGVERRTPGSCRRVSDRRVNTERRHDPRNGNAKPRGFWLWLRSITRTRLGVDRRRNHDQRVITDRRRHTPNSMLTKEELEALLQ